MITVNTADAQELLKPFLLACESKNAKLASIALVSFQKLLANDAVSEEGVPLIIAGLEQVCVLHHVHARMFCLPHTDMVTRVRMGRLRSYMTKACS
jgi:Dimerisation and cyclophilin-binding domain of Mon2